jgi:hypothetical protein
MLGVTVVYESKKTISNLFFKCGEYILEQKYVQSCSQQAGIAGIAAPTDVT